MSATTPLRLGDERPTDGHPRVSLSEVLSALSHALDLTEGQPLGHTVRACVIGMRIAEELGLSADDRSALYYALLLKDAGCSSNAARMAALFGSDDRVVKPRMKLVDWHKRVGLALATARNVGRGRSLRERVRAFWTIAHTENMTRDLIAVRCDRGADIARRLGFPAATADAIRSLDEHWCGLGYAEGIAGDAIPLLSRICNIAQSVEAVHASDGLEPALRLVRRRAATWFDPALADIVASWRNDAEWWRELRTNRVDEIVLTLEPADRVETADAARLDDVARAFADIIDAKSPFTFHHSVRVADYAQRIAQRCGLDGDEQRRLHRAGLLHDIGKLGVSNRILDKPGALTTRERAEVERHPQHTLGILSRVGAFGAFAWTAALHHEKLDGSGYPYGLAAPQLDRAARVLAVADIYDALTSDRPYRAGASHRVALDTLAREAGTRLDADAIGALAVL